MRFYVMSDEQGTVIGCTMKRDAAIADVRENCGPEARVEMFEIPVNAETIRRILGAEGGYASEIRTVYVNPESD